MARYGYRRRLGRGSDGATYAGVMGLHPVPFTRKRKFSYGGSTLAIPTTTSAPGGPRMGLARRVRPKLSRSYTRTATKRKRRRGRKVVKAGDNATAGYSVMGFGPLYNLFKSRVRTLGERHFEDGVATTVTNYNGTQGIFLCEPLMTRAHMKVISDAMSTGTSSSKSIVGDGKTIIHIRNQSNILVKCKLYEIYTRRTPPLLAGTVSQVATPKQAWYKFCTDQGIASLTLPGPIVVNGAHRVDMTPYCSDVAYYYKIGKVTSLHLEPGMQHNHTISHNFFKRLKREHWENTDANAVSIGGWTRHFMVVFYSGLVHNKNVNPSEELVGTDSLEGVKTAANQITVSDVTLDIVVRNSFKYMIDSQSTNVFTEDPTYPYKLDLADVDEEQMGEADDQPGTVVANQ